MVLKIYVIELEKYKTKWDTLITIINISTIITPVQIRYFTSLVREHKLFAAAN